MSNRNVCYQCGLCCKLFYINLNKEEFDSKRYRTIFEAIETFKSFDEAKKCGAHFLAKKSDGSCVYLKADSCSIHENRPKVCRGFFCTSSDKKYSNMRVLVSKRRKDLTSRSHESQPTAIKGLK